MKKPAFYESGFKFQFLREKYADRAFYVLFHGEHGGMFHVVQIAAPAPEHGRFRRVEPRFGHVRIVVDFTDAAPYGFFESLFVYAAAAVHHEGQTGRLRDAFDDGKIQFRFRAVKSVRRAERDGERVDARFKGERRRLVGVGIIIARIAARQLFAALGGHEPAQFRLHAHAHIVRRLSDLARDCEIFRIGIRGGVYHHRRKADAKRPSDHLFRNAVVEVHAYGNGRVFRGGEHGGSHERNIVVFVMYFRVGENDGLVQFFRRADDRLQTVESRGVEHAHRLFIALCER